MQLDCAKLQSDLVLVTLISSTSWKGAEKWSINQPPISPAYSPNIPEVQALVILSPHLDQQILASDAHDIKGTPSSVWEPVTTGSPRDGIGPEASRLRLSHWAGPSVTGSAKLSQSFYGGIIIMVLTEGKPVPLAWEFIYKLGEVTRVTSTILPDMGRKCVTEA